MVAMVNSKQKQLKPDAILAIALKNTGSNYAFRTAYLAYIAEVSSKDAKFYQFGNTTFITHNLGKRRCLFSVRNADTAQNLVENGAKFAKAVYKDGYDIAIMQYSDPTITNLLKAIGRKAGTPDMGFSVYKTKKDLSNADDYMGQKPVYMAVLKCGPYRKGEK